MSTSSKIPANRAEIVRKQLGENESKIKYPTEINKSEKDFYHVLSVGAKFNQQTLETKFSSRVQKFNKKSWNGIKDRLKKVGHQKTYILHNPTLVEKVEKAKEVEAKTDRAILIDKAKDLGYDGALNVKSSTLEAFIISKQA